MVLSQEKKFGQHFEVEVNGFYFREVDENQNEFFNELSFSPSFNITLSDKFNLGIRSYIVRGRSTISPMFNGWHTLIGPNIRYAITRSQRIELNAEVGYFIGNYCPNCTPSNDFYNSSLHYIGVMLDFGFQVIKTHPNLWLKASFASNNPINTFELHGYNLPLIGIQYKFGRGI